MRINMVMFLMIGSCVQILRAITDSCLASKRTVQFVKDCPQNEKSWREAAARKKCLGYASNCSEPERLVYHCVINAFVNQTLEVCAYERFIMLGYCAEYSFGGNRIQQNSKAICSNIPQNSCPDGYPSTEAYKYQNCYELTKKTMPVPPMLTTPSTTNSSQYMNSPNPSDKILPVGIIAGIAVTLVLMSIISVVIYTYVTRRNKRRKKRYMHQASNKMERSAMF